jgi:hypothetical protein
VAVAIVLDKPISPGATTGLGVAYLPAPQSVQYVDPVAVEYWQSVQYVDPVAAEYLPMFQSVLTAEPVPFLYFPAVHAMQVPPFAPVYPALHEQLFTTVLPLSETEFTGHCAHLVIGSIINKEHFFNLKGKHVVVVVGTR